MKFYTGIGSRKTPKSILAVMTKLSGKLSKTGWTLRSGGADGADSAFEKGVIVEGLMEIYHPNSATKAAVDIAKQFHPNWGACKPFVRKLHARNSFQVLGSALDSPSKFLVCWTPDAAYNHNSRSIETGGTGTAISIADHYGIEIFNLANKFHLKRVRNFLFLF
jgi:hypothetical protein